MHGNNILRQERHKPFMAQTDPLTSFSADGWRENGKKKEGLEQTIIPTTRNLAQTPGTEEDSGHPCKNPFISQYHVYPAFTPYTP
jgi:hypothetical protein